MKLMENKDNISQNNQIRLTGAETKSNLIKWM